MRRSLEHGNDFPKSGLSGIFPIKSSTLHKFELIVLKMMAVVSVYDSRYGFSDLKSVWHYEIHDLYTIVEYVSQILCDL